jgi:hypothetical protein
MKSPQPPPSKIGNPVKFSPPVGVGKAAKYNGIIKDEVWGRVCYDKEWGFYIYTSQLIEWSAGGTSVRMTYYYQREGSGQWRFGQYSIEDSPEIIREILEATLKKNWRSK